MGKRGHVRIDSTLRVEEVHLLDHWTEAMEQNRQRRLRNPETYLPSDATRFTRAGMIRAAVRYAMEHREEFVTWLLEDPDAK